jgi:HEAT repeats
MDVRAKASVIRAAVGALLAGLLLTAVAVHAAASPPCCAQGQLGDLLASALQVLDGTLRDGPSGLRSVSFEMLSQHYCAEGRASRECVRLAAEGMQSPEWKVRLLDLPNAFLPGMPQPLARKMTMQAAKDSSSTLRRAEAKLLAEHPQPWAREVVETLLHSSDPIVRVHAAASMVALGERSYARVLNEGLNNKDPEVALEAAAHIIGLHVDGSARARDRMVELLKQRDEVVRANAVYCLSELRRDSWSVELMERALFDASPLVRIASVTSLPQVGLSRQQSIKFLNLLDELWSKDNNSAIRVDILDAVERMERQEMLSSQAAARFVNAKLNQKHDSVIDCLAMGILSYPDHRKYLERLLAVAENPHRDFNARLFALSELGRSHDATLTKRLFKLIERQAAAASESAAFRVSCAGAIVELYDGPPTQVEAAASGDQLMASGTQR